MNTQDILNIALELAGLESLPEDSGINVHKDDVKHILTGIDMEGPELLLAKELGADCVVSHHPYAGTSVTDFHKVMERQIRRMVHFGVPINKAQKALKKRMAQVDLSHHTVNFDRAQSIAGLLGMGYMNIHMPADVISESVVQAHLDYRVGNNKRATLGDVLGALNELSEYKASVSKPVIRVGGESDYAGKIAVLMAGGTGGGADVYRAYFEAGVGTIICMHIPEDVKKAVEEQNVGNVIVAGHMASDSIGMNRIIREWRKNGLKVTPCCGILGNVQENDV